MNILRILFGPGKPAEAGASYGAPGAGNSPLMSMLSIVFIIGGWFIITQPVWNNGIAGGAREITASLQAATAGTDMQPRAEEVFQYVERIHTRHDELESGDSAAVPDGLGDLERIIVDAETQLQYFREDAQNAGADTLVAAISGSEATTREMKKRIFEIREVERKGGEISLKIPLIKALFVPSPQAVISKFISLFSEEFSGGTLPHHIWESCRRVFLAFLLAVLLAVPLGIMMGINRLVRGFFDPPIEFYRPIPPLAYLPLMIVWFGIGEEPKILLIFLAIFAPLVINARAGVRSVAIEQIHAAYSMGATKVQVIWHVILKGAMPEILTGMRIGIAFGWTTLVAAELAAAQAGLGAMIKSASDFLVTDVIFVGILVIAAIAYLFDMVMRWIDKVAVPWKGKI